MRILLPTLIAVAVATAAQAAPTIKKCQDADGKWHYGDHAAWECDQRAKITEIDDRGLKVKERAAPPTQEELDAKRHAQQRRREQERDRSAQQALDQRLLDTYESPASIVKARDERLAAMDRQINADESFKQQLVAELAQLRELDGRPREIASLEHQISEYDQVIGRKLRAREQLAARYNDDLSRFRQLLDNSPAAADR